MKKKRWIPLLAAIVLLAILFVPIPQGSYDDGGTREWIALTYKIVDWNRLYAIGGGESFLYEKTRLYGPADRNKSIGELWETERIFAEAELFPAGEPVDEKPVIYLYPEEETDVTVKLAYSGTLTCTPYRLWKRLS